MKRVAFITMLLVATLAAPAFGGPPWFGTPVLSHQPTGMPGQARAAAVSPDGAVLYIVDSTSHVLEYSGKTGTYLGGFGGVGTNPGEFDNPRGIAVDPYGDVWVADTGNGRVQKLTTTGKPLLSFSTPQPIGVAAGPSGLYVLSGVLRGVSLHSWNGKDLGGFIATFPNGFSATANYGGPNNSAVAIAADPSSRAVVLGSVTQPLVDPTRNCSSPLSKLPDLPDPLVAPALGTFDSKGGVVAERFPFDAGSVCWTDFIGSWSYGLSGATGGPSVAVDPATGSSYALVDDAGVGFWGGASPYFVLSDQQDWFPIWSPTDGPTVPAPSGGLSTPAYGLYGQIRTFAIGCDSTLYLVMDKSIELIPSKTPNATLCKTRSHLGEATFLLAPALGAPAPPGNTLGKLTVGTVCHAATACSGTVDIGVLRCSTCRRIATIKQKVKVPAETAKPLRFALPRKIAAGLRAGEPFTLRTRLGHARPQTFPLKVPVSLDTTCGGTHATAFAAASQLTVSGKLSPAKRGVRINIVVTGPSGAPQLLTARTNSRGRWTLVVPTGANGAWTVTAALAATRTRSAAADSCGVTVGTPPTLAPLPPGSALRDIRNLDLALSCPGSGTAGHPITVAGQLSPADGGVPVSFTINGGPQQTTTTAADGSFGVTFTPDAAGSWTVAAQASDAGATLSNNCSVPVGKQATTLTLGCPSSALPFPGDHTFSGTLNPAVPGATVTVDFSSPGRPSVQDTGTVDASGSYSVDFQEPAPGNWTAQASYPGDGARDASTSGQCSFMVG